MAKSNYWADCEDDALRELWGALSADEIAQMMGRHRLTILKKAKELGLREGRSRKWSDAEIQFLKENYPTKRVEWCEEQLGRSKRSVYTMAERLGLKVEWSYRLTDKDGYAILIFPDSVKIQEHRYVMERFLKRKLKSTEVVHHLDMDKQNNGIDNLVILNPAIHNTLHAMINRHDTQGLIDFADNLSRFDKSKYEKWLTDFLQRDIV